MFYGPLLDRSDSAMEQFITCLYGEAVVESGPAARVQRLLDSCHALNIFHFLVILLLCLLNPPAESFIAPSHSKTDFCLKMNVKINFDKALLDNVT